MASLKRLGLGALVLATATCADVSVRHVASTDFTTEGARYYLPRPYLAVKEPFPVGGEDFLTTGTLQDDWLVHIDLPAGLPAPVLRFFKADDPRVGLVAPGLVMQRRGQTARPHRMEQAGRRARRWHVTDRRGTGPGRRLRYALRERRRRGDLGIDRGPALGAVRRRHAA